MLFYRFKDRIDNYKREIDDYNKSLKSKNFSLTDDEYEFLNSFNEVYNVTYENYLREKKELESKLKDNQSKILVEFDKDGNGELDTVEVKDDFDKLVKKHQSKIIETDRSTSNTLLRSQTIKNKRKIFNQCLNQ